MWSDLYPNKESPLPLMKFAPQLLLKAIGNHPEVTLHQDCRDQTNSKPCLKLWSREDDGCSYAPFTNNLGPRKAYIHRSVVTCLKTKKVLLDQQGIQDWTTKQLKFALPPGLQHVRTTLWHCDPKCSDRPEVSELSMPRNPRSVPLRSGPNTNCDSFVFG